MGTDDGTPASVEGSRDLVHRAGVPLDLSVDALKIAAYVETTAHDCYGLYLVTGAATTFADTRGEATVDRSGGRVN